MSLVESGSDLSSGEGGWEEARGGREGGEGAVDGDTEGAGLGKEGQMAYGVVRIELIV